MLFVDSCSATNNLFEFRHAVDIAIQNNELYSIGIYTCCQ